ncbi:Hydrolase (plasmid) [Roseomonas mucosa]|nr:Hydrolase [Roseomonas mucosa]
MGCLGTDHQVIAYDRRGFGETQAEREDHSAVEDLTAVLDAVTEGKPAVLVGCSMGGKIALDAALRYPARVRGLVLIAPSVEGAPAPDYSPEVAEMVAWAQAAEASGDPTRTAAAKARLWLDGPLAPEGRVGGAPRRLFLDMIGIALSAPAVGANLDRTPAYGRLGTITVPTFVIQGDLDFPHIQARSRHIAETVPGGSLHELTDVAHLPALERPDVLADLISNFLAQHLG